MCSLPPVPAAPPEAEYLGRRVRVVLNREGDLGPEVVAHGRLLRFSAMGECVLWEDDGDVHWCWPMLEVQLDE